MSSVNISKSLKTLSIELSRKCYFRLQALLDFTRYLISEFVLNTRNWPEKMKEMCEFK